MNRPKAHAVSRPTTACSGRRCAPPLMLSVSQAGSDMRCFIFRTTISIALLLCTGCKLQQQTEVGRVIEAMRSAKTVESYRVVGPGIVLDARIRNLAGWAIEAQGPNLDARQVALVCRLVDRANQARCGEADAGVFNPHFGLNFMGADTTKVLIDQNCTYWSFFQGSKGLDEISGFTSCISDSLDRLVSLLFTSEQGP